MLENSMCVIYFSKDRPMQLDLCLKTFSSWCMESQYVAQYVLYKTSTKEYEDAYQELFSENPFVYAIREGEFKKQLLRLLENKKYVLFVTDDTVFVNNFSVIEMMDCLQNNPKTIGVSLRLGKNTEYCYPTRRKNVMPIFKNYGSTMLEFNWTSVSEGDFSYPLELSSSFYRIDDLKSLFEDCYYFSPNSLEWAMFINLAYVEQKYPALVCYRTSAAFSIPLNKVQTENSNRAGEDPRYSVRRLLEDYNKGYRFDTKPLDYYEPTGCHQEFNLTYRKDKQNEHRL